MNIILLGPPGAGKGTQGERLGCELGYPHIASGDIFRAIRREDTPLAREVRGYMDRGEYVPDALTIELILARLRQPDASNGFILDGFPRTRAQAQALDRSLEASGQRVDVALWITAPNEILTYRLVGRIVCPRCHAIYNTESKPPRHAMTCDVCGHELERRTDEEVDVIRARLDTFTRQTQPLVEYYRGQGCLVEVDGSQPMEDVAAAVDAAVQTRVT